MTGVPEWMLSPVDEFVEEFEARKMHGQDVLSGSSVAVVGLARNCGERLEANIVRLQASITGKATDWRVFICENDSTDNTKAVIDKFAVAWPDNVSTIMRDLGRKHRPNEFAGPRTEELAEYRNECLAWVKRRCEGFDYTIVIDWDSWGGWTLSGAMTGFSYLSTEPQAYGSASFSLLEHPFTSFDPEEKKMKVQFQWVHYDCWALRLNSYWDDYGRGVGAWKHHWLPPVGSPPIRVCSAFGGFCIYKTEDFLQGNYSGQDCEHVGFHKSVETKTGKALYLNPSQRTIMQWVERNAKHSDGPDKSIQV